jgi:hypothetical protein
MRVLEADRTLAPLMEPDNESRSAPAIWGKRRAGRFPVLAPGDNDAEYRWLWSWILDGAPEGGRLELTAPLLRAVRPVGRRRFYRGQASPLMQLAGALGRRPRYRRPGSRHDPRRLLVKTVHLPLAVEWLASEFDVDVVVLLRHPANVLASWISLDLNDQFARLDDRPAIRRRIVEAGEIPAPRADPLARMVWQIAVLNLGLEEAAARNPAWIVRTHEDLCVDPMAKFQVLYRQLGLTWNAQAEHYLTSNDRPGEGFPTQRVASDQPDAWKRRLAPGQIETMGSVLSEFAFSTWTQAELAP